MMPLIVYQIPPQSGGAPGYYAKRSQVIEGVFAEAKQWHGLERAWRRGLMKMRIQSLLIASVMNYKRLEALCWLVLQLEQRCGKALRAFWSNLKKAMKFFQSVASTRILTIEFTQKDALSTSPERWGTRALSTSPPKE